jgi:hypothetical protein
MTENQHGMYSSVNIQLTTQLSDGFWKRMEPVFVTPRDAIPGFPFQRRGEAVSAYQEDLEVLGGRRLSAHLLP